MPYISTQDESQRRSLTIYNDEFGLVKETRRMNLSEQDQEVRFLDVPQKIEIDSILIDGLDVLELNYEYDLVSKRKLLEKYVGQMIHVLNPATKEKVAYRLLSVADGIVVENVETKQIRINPIGQMILPALPDGLIVKPALIWKIHPALSPTDVRVSYLTKGVSWDANYVIVLKENHFDLIGWVNIQNESGATFEDVQLKLIAGEVNRVHDPVKHEWVIFEMACEQFKQKSFADYHMYTLNGTTTLKNNQSKQIQFLEKSQIPVQMKYEYAPYKEIYYSLCRYIMLNGYDYEKYLEKYERYLYEDDYVVGCYLEFENTKANGLGVPLPKGKIRVYRQLEEEGSLQWIGEDYIDHTPINEKIMLSLINPLDVQCSSRVKNRYIKDGAFYEQIEILIHNTKNISVNIEICQYFDDILEIRSNRYGKKYDFSFEVIETNHEFEKIGFAHLYFNVDVKPLQKKVIQFTYCIKKSLHLEITQS